MLPAHVLAKLPATPMAQAWLRPLLPAIDEALDAARWARTRALALDRVRAAMRADVFEVDLPADDEHEATVLAASYPLARAILTQVSVPVVAQRFATSEARAAGAALRSLEPPELAAVALDLGVEARDGRDEIGIHVLSLLPLLRHLRAPEYRLVNLPLRHGWVGLPTTKAARLLQEAYRERVQAALDQKAAPELAKRLEPLAGPFRAEAQALFARSHAELAGPLKPEAFPPCMTAILNAIRAGQNAPHEARFAIVSFLHHVGMSRDAIIDDVFTTVPDYAREVTRYQVEHITGGKGRDPYTPPACQTLQVAGLCPMMARARPDWDPLCQQVTHPLTYYRRAAERPRPAPAPENAPG